jgi:hypothetical protein
LKTNKQTNLTAFTIGYAFSLLVAGMTLQIKVKNNNNNKLSLAEIEVSSCEI